MSAPSARNTRPTVLAGRHQGLFGSPKRPAVGRRTPSPSGSSNSSGMPGRLRPAAAHPWSACAGRGSPRAVRPPTIGAGLWYSLDSSRLSRVVRVASLHYSPGLRVSFPRGEWGEPAPLRGETEINPCSVVTKSCEANAQACPCKGHCALRCIMHLSIIQQPDHEEKI